MGTYKVTTSDYYFEKPELLSEVEYNQVKRLLLTNNNIDISPKQSFWNEFQYEKYCIYTLIGGLILASIEEKLVFIPGLAFGALVISMLFGSAKSMLSFQDFLNEKNRYFSNLKAVVINSKDYEDFKIQMSKLYPHPLESIGYMKMP